jgi:hypothetical protein
MAITAVIGSFLGFIGVTGVDAGVISNAVTGVISLVTFVTAIIAWRTHKSAVAQAQAQTASVTAQ